jgi:hypothetical protein
MSKARWTIAALAAAAIALVIAAWLDNTVMPDAQEQARTSDVSPLATMIILEGLLVAGSILLLGVLAWRSASLVVGLAYVVVGGFFAAQWWLWWNLASARVDVLPEVLALALRNLFYNSTGGGPLNDVGTIAAGMLIAGVATLARWWRGRAVAPGRTEVIDPATGSSLP